MFFEKCNQNVIAGIHNVVISEFNRPFRSGNEMNPKMRDKKKSFVIQIIDNQNLTWQGSLSVVGEGRTLYFRSALELIRLIDSAIFMEEGDDPEDK